jgi:DNA-binding response OmpR family regulator
MPQKKILVVEDETELLELVKIRLEANSYSVITAINGQEAYNLVGKEMPDLIILDIMLPGIDGFKLCRMLKFDEKFKNIPVILFSARTQETDKEIGKTVGADLYITKPFNAQFLLDSVRSLLKENSTLNSKSKEVC